MRANLKILIWIVLVAVVLYLANFGGVNLLFAGGSYFGRVVGFRSNGSCAHFTTSGVEYVGDPEYAGKVKSWVSSEHFDSAPDNYVGLEGWLGSQVVAPSSCSLTSLQDGDVSLATCTLVSDPFAVGSAFVCTCDNVKDTSANSFGGQRQASFAFSFWVSKTGASCAPVACSKQCGVNETLGSDCVCKCKSGFKCEGNSCNLQCGEGESLSVESCSCKPAHDLFAANALIVGVGIFGVIWLAKKKRS